MRILVDMNLTQRWVNAFVLAEHEAVHWSAIGSASATDFAISKYARENSFVLMTNDLDFPRLLAYTFERKPSVILLRGEPLTPEVRGSTVLRANAESVMEPDYGAILSIDWLDRPRARLLPLSSFPQLP